MKRFAWLLICLMGVLMVSACSADASTGNDWILPYSVVTPGVTNPDVTPMNIQQTICKRGWTRTIRPSLSYIWKLKTKQLKGDYRAFAKIFGTNTKDYWEDHLIPLSLGGHPSDPRNLWPQPTAGNNAHRKNEVGAIVYGMVCAGKMPLYVAQKLFMFPNGWVAVYDKYARG